MRPCPHSPRCPGWSPMVRFIALSVVNLARCAGIHSGGGWWFLVESVRLRCSNRVSEPAHSVLVMQTTAAPSGLKQPSIGRRRGLACPRSAHIDLVSGRSEIALRRRTIPPSVPFGAASRLWESGRVAESTLSATLEENPKRPGLVLNRRRHLHPWSPKRQRRNLGAELLARTGKTATRGLVERNLSFTEGATCLGSADLPSASIDESL